VSFRTVMFALFALAVVGCVDGTTPDCSDAASHCGPDFDAYPPDSATDSAPTDAPSDGMPEAGTDAPAG
jgi:hypothetical protein